MIAFIKLLCWKSIYLYVNNFHFFSLISEEMYEVWICHNLPGVALSWNVTDSLWLGHFFCFFNSSQKQLEAIKQLPEDAVRQGAALRKKVPEASPRQEEAEGQVGRPLTTLHFGEASADVPKTIK